MYDKRPFDSSKYDYGFELRSNPIRYHEPGHLHFITTTCYDHKTFFSKPWTCKLLLDSFNESRSKKHFLICGYVIMPEHVHLIIEPHKCGDISESMKWLKWYSAKMILSALKDRGKALDRLWLHRFYDFNIYTYQKFLEKLNYSHMNPVRRGLVTSPQDWPFSSYRNYELNDDSIFSIDRPWNHG